MRSIWVAPGSALTTVAPVVAAEVPITDATEAHKLLDSSKTVGKVVLTVRDP